MTKLRTPETVEYELSEAIRRFGAKRLANAAGVSPSSLACYSDNDDPREMKVRHALDMDRHMIEAGESPAFVRFMVEMAGFAKAPAHKPPCPTKRVGALAKEGGEAKSTYAAAMLADGDFLAAYDAIREIDEAIQEYTRAKRDITAKIRANQIEIFPAEAAE